MNFFKNKPNINPNHLFLQFFYFYFWIVMFPKNEKDLTIGVLAFLLFSIITGLYFFFNNYSLGNMKVMRRTFKAVKYGLIVKLPRVVLALFFILLLNTLLLYIFNNNPFISNVFVVIASIYVSFAAFFNFSKDSNIKREVQHDYDEDLQPLVSTAQEKNPNNPTLKFSEEKEGLRENRLNNKRKNGKLFRIGILVFALLFITSAFYWYEIRPTIIKSDCSWVSYVDLGEPAFPGRTAEEAAQENASNAASNPTECTAGGLYHEYLVNKGRCKPTDLTAELPREAIPVRILKRNASDKEYEDCLRHNGL